MTRSNDSYKSIVNLDKRVQKFTVGNEMTLKV